MVIVTRDTLFVASY